MVRGFCGWFGGMPIGAVMALAACGPDFAPSYLLTKERVLAVRAEPPEAEPGQSVVLTALVAGPAGVVSDDAAGALQWWRCSEGGNGGDGEGAASTEAHGCGAETQRRMLGSGSAVVTSWTSAEVPAPSLDAEAGFAIMTDQPLEDALLHALSGYGHVVGATLRDNEGGVVDSIKRVVLFPFDQPISALDPRLAALDVRVDDAGTLRRNENPRLEGVEVHEGSVDGPLVEQLQAGQSYWLRPLYDAASLQKYRVLTLQTEGLVLDDPVSLDELTGEQLVAQLGADARCEVPAFSWYVTAGVLQSEVSVDEQVLLGSFAARGIECPPLASAPRRPEVQFTAPSSSPSDAAIVVHGFVVMRDGRGGTDFFAFDLPVAEGGAP